MSRKQTEITKLKISKANSVKIGHIYIHHGYKWIKIAEHKWISLHRYLVEKYIGRRLKSSEIIHHIDENEGLNNKLSNLYIFKKSGNHTAFELLIRDKIINRFILKSNLKEFKIKR